MATIIEYSQETELDDALQEQLDDPTISAKLKDKIKVVACFCIRRKDDETTVRGKGDAVKIKKVPPDMHIFMKPKAHFVLVVDYGFWEGAKPDSKRCEIYRALTRIQVDAKDDGFKLRTSPWGIQDNLDVLRKFGPHNDTWVAVAEVFRSKLLSATKGALDRRRQETEPDADPDPEPDAEEQPRVVARPVPIKPKPQPDDNKPLRPPRRPPESAPKSAAAAGEPEPEPEPEPLD